MNKLLIIAVAIVSLYFPLTDTGAQPSDPFQSITPVRPPPPHRPRPAGSGQGATAAPAPPEPLGTFQTVGWVAVVGSQCYFWNSYPSKNAAWATWTGGCSDGYLSGTGTLTFSDGRSWTGEYRDGSRNGHGSHVAPNGYRYDGEYRDNVANGHGIVTWANGNHFEGEFINDKPTGPGLLVVGTQAYSGIWKEGCFQDATRRMALFRPLSSCPGPQGDGQMAFDGTYAGRQQVTRTDNDSSCANLDRPIRMVIADRTIKVRWGSVNIEAKINADGSFSANKIGAFLLLQSFNGRITGDLLEADVSNSHCALHLSLKKL